MKFNLLNLAKSGLVLGALLLGSASVLAQTVSGSWEVTFYLNPSRSTGATQCVVYTQTGGITGEPISGTWLSTTFPGWNGQWIVKGDHLQWYGFTDTGLATSEYGSITSRSIMSGEVFNHFLPLDGVTSTSGSWVAKRVSSCGQSNKSLSPNAFDPSN